MGEEYEDYLMRKREHLHRALKSYVDMLNPIIRCEKNVNYRRHSVISLTQDIEKTKHLLSDISIKTVNIVKKSDYQKLLIDVKVRENEEGEILLKFFFKSNVSATDEYIHQIINNLIFEGIKVVSTYAGTNNTSTKIRGNDYLTFNYEGKILCVYPDNFTKISYEAMLNIYGNINGYLQGKTFTRLVSIGDDSGNILPILHQHFKESEGIFHSSSSHAAALENLKINNISDCTLS